MDTEKNLKYELVTQGNQREKKNIVYEKNEALWSQSKTHLRQGMEKENKVAIWWELSQCLYVF